MNHRSNNRNSHTHTGGMKKSDVMRAAPDIADKRDELEKLAESDEGQKVKSMLGGEEKLASMLKSGDIDGLRGAVSGIMKTSEGAELMRKLSEIMK